MRGTRFARPYRPKGRGIEPLLRLRSDEMDNRVTHFASSLVVIKVKCEEPLFRLRSDEMDNRVTHFAENSLLKCNFGGIMKLYETTQNIEAIKSI